MCIRDSLQGAQRQHALAEARQVVHGMERHLRVVSAGLNADVPA